MTWCRYNDNTRDATEPLVSEAYGFPLSETATTSLVPFRAFTACHGNTLCDFRAKSKAIPANALSGSPSLLFTSHRAAADMWI